MENIFVRQDSEYKMENMALYFRPKGNRAWMNISLETMIKHGENFYDVYKYYGKEKYYTEKIHEYARAYLKGEKCRFRK